jgi:integrase
MSAKPRTKDRAPTGCRAKHGRYFRVQYTGIVDGKRKYKWIALTRVDEGLPALYRALSELDIMPTSFEDTSVPARMSKWLITALPGLSAAEQKEKARKGVIISKAFKTFKTRDVTAAHVQDFLNAWATGKKPRLNMAGKYRAMLKQFFDWVIIRGDIRANPVDPVKVDSPPPNMRHMDDEAFALIRSKLLGETSHKAASGEMMQVYVDLSYLTGHGGVDVRTLRWADVDEAAGLIRVERSKVRKKTAAKVDIVITPAIAAVLERAKKHMKAKARVSPYVVHNLEGSAYTSHGVGTAWERARERAAKAMPERKEELLKFTLKDLRAKFATDAKSAGYSDEQIAAGMAHADTSMTTVYLKKRMAKRSNIELVVPGEKGRHTEGGQSGA